MRVDDAFIHVFMRPEVVGINDEKFVRQLEKRFLHQQGEDDCEPHAPVLNDPFTLIETWKNRASANCLVEPSELATPNTLQQCPKFKSQAQNIGHHFVPNPPE